MRLAALLLLSACDAVFGLGTVHVPDGGTPPDAKAAVLDACPETIGGNSADSLVVVCLSNLVDKGLPTDGTIDTDIATNCAELDLPMCALVVTSGPMLVTNLRATGSKPLLLIAETIIIEGRLELESRLTDPKPGAGSLECSPGTAGVDAGGAGGSYGTKGGNGGTPNETGGTGQLAVASTNGPTTWSQHFVGGCDGGAGGSPANGGSGGAGGGAVYLAANTITIDSIGSINASGAGGHGAKGAGGGGGGGGAGGAIVFDTNALTINGSAFANGGGGGGAAGTAMGTTGTAGTEATTYNAKAQGGTIGGGAGGISISDGTAGTTPGQIAGGGGGGGGVGYIVQYSSATTSSSSDTSPPILTK